MFNGTAGPTPLTSDEINTLKAHLNGADPAAPHIPNATVIRLLATLDDATESLDAAFTEWGNTMTATARRAIRLQMLAGRYASQRGRAMAELDWLRTQLGDSHEQWTVGTVASDGIINWHDPAPTWNEAECRDYVAMERERFGTDMAVGVRIVGDWYDPDRGPVREVDEQEMADLKAAFEAAVKSGSDEMLIIPPDDEDLGDVEAELRHAVQLRRRTPEERRA